MKHLSFPSIEQFRHVIKHVKQNANYHGEPLPVLEFEGTVKLHGCVSKDTLITLADGSHERICDIIPGSSIISYNEEKRCVEYDIVKDVIIQELDKDWCELVFDNDTKLSCTQDHPILTTQGWVEAINLTSDHILVEIE